MLYNGANVCLVSSIAVSFIKKKCSFRSYKLTRQIRYILIKAYCISMRFTHFQVTFQQPNVHLFVIINAAWTSQMFMKFSLQVGHCTKSNFRSQVLFILATHRGYYSYMATGSVTIPTWQRARLLYQHGNGLGYYSNMASG